MDAGSAVADVAILTSGTYANATSEKTEKKATESGSFDDEKVSVSDIEKGPGAIAHGDDIVDVKGKIDFMA